MMKNQILFLFILGALFGSCQKIKEKKFTGTFSGTINWYEEKHEFNEELGMPDPYLTRTEGSKEITMEVISDGDYIYISGYPKHKINYVEARLRENSLNYYYRGGGGKGFEYTVTENQLNYRRFVFTYAGSYEYNYSRSFTGIKIEE